MLRFDHVIIGVHDLDQAVADYKSLGFNVVYGGEHATETTHNALIVFRDGSYLELIARTGKLLKRGVDGIDFATFLGEDEGIVGYAFYTDDMQAALDALRESGIEPPAIQHGKRLTKDGIELRWQLIHIRDGNCHFLLICDETPRDLRIPGKFANATHTNGSTGVRNVYHLSKDFVAIHQRLQALTGKTPDANHAFRVGTTQVIINEPTTEAMQAHHDARGDSVWRLMLDGVGHMVSRVDKEQAHGVHITILGPEAM